MDMSSPRKSRKKKLAVVAPPEPVAPHADVSVLSSMIRVEDKDAIAYVIAVLVAEKGHVTHTAERIGITTRALYKWIRGNAELSAAFEKHARGRGAVPKLSDADVAELHKLRAQDWTIAAIAKKFEVDVSTISLILNGKRRAG